MTDIIKFHLLAHIFISAIGGMLLLAIWYNIRMRFRPILEEGTKEKRVDKGLLFLSLAMFTWVLAGIWGLVGYYYGFANTAPANIGERMFSIVNNLFLLLSLFYFYYAPPFIYNNEKNVGVIIGIIVGVSLVTLGLNHWFGPQTDTDNINISNIPDLILSGFLSALLMISFYKTFMHRQLKTVAIISVVVIGLMFVSQLPEVFKDSMTVFTNNLIKIVSKTSLIAICLVLATTWVIRLASMPKPNEMTIHFLDWSLVKISIPSKDIHNQLIDFGSKATQYRNLLKFAIRRKFGEGKTQSILVGNGGELSNQTYLTRIIININEIMNLTEGQQLERRDLFTFIGYGMYRLRMIPEHIQIDEGLLSEFIQNADNQKYADLCN
ncbi:MAG: hypothetical protein DHS20C18_04210 [Saprospiraceae bacterium]|nr:MAG: hypothetical protein DHS20C18_04210 [Saprospiraceae bacterium]